MSTSSAIPSTSHDPTQPKPHLFPRISPAPRVASSSAPLKPLQLAEPSQHHRDLAVAMDGSFVETTSESAAKALAKWYAEQGGGDYQISSREEGGRVFYRIRPRSLSPERMAPTFASSDRLNSPPTPHQPLPRPSLPPGANPTFALQAASPLRPVVAPPNSRPLRTSKSIPSLRWGTHSSSERLGENQLENPNQLSTHLSAHSRTHSLRRAGSTPSLSSQMRSGGKVHSPPFKTAAGSQGDVLGRLLGWSSSTPPSAGAISPERPPVGVMAYGDRSQIGTAQLGLPAALRGGGMSGSPVATPREIDTTDLPDDLVDVLNSSSDPAPGHFDLTLGPNSKDPVCLPRTHYSSLSKSPPFGMKQQTTSDLREVSSSDSIRTAKAYDHDQDQTTKFARPRFQDPEMFDLFQTLDQPPTLPPLPTSFVFPNRDSISASPPTISPSASIPDVSRVVAQDVAVSATAGDDPRFILWGYKGTGSVDHTLPSPLNLNASRFSRRPSGVTEAEFGSPTSNSDRGGSSGTTATSTSNRWSLSRKGLASGTEGSPASSVRDSVSSGGFSAPHRMLLAATVERWIAELTSKIEGDLLSAFFLTYRQFITSLDLLHLLITRFNWAVSPASSPEDEAGRRIVRVRTFVVIRHWLLNHFVEDFIPNRELRTTLTDWLNGSSRDERLKASPKDYRLIKGLKKLVRRLKEMHVEVPSEAVVDLLPHAPTPRMGAVAPSSSGSGFWPKKKSSATLASTATKPHLEKVSDEDVDLVLEHHALNKRSPTRPNRKNSTAGVPFLSKLDHHTTTFTIDEAPLSQSTTPRSSTLFSARSPFPLPNSQHPIARSFTSALGTFGRFKRMLGNMAANSGAQPQFPNCGSVEAFDEEVFEKSDTGDLLWVKGGLERYLDYFGISRGTSENGEGSFGLTETIGDGGEVVVLKDEEGEGRDDLVDGVSSATEDQVRFPSVEAPPKPAATHVPFGGFQLEKTTGQSGFDLLDQPSSNNNFFLTRPHSGRIELDDVDLSDEDEDVVEVKKTLKRFPAAHNLRLAANLGGSSSPYRGSIESVSSYGAPIGSRPLSAAVSLISEPDMPVGAQTVPNFILEGIDSDDDEPGDVEAALRRLEGLVDDSKEKEKARRVERQMAKSEQLKMSLPLTPDVASSTADSDSAGRASIASSSIGSNWVPVTPFGKSTEGLPPAPSPEFATTSTRRSSLASPASSPLAGKMMIKPISLVGGTFPRKSGPNRKPSLSNLFGPTPLPRPFSTRSTLSPPIHRSFLLNFKTEVLAQQFCLIERDMLRVLGWQELVEGTWRDPAQRFDVLDWEAYLKERRKLDLEGRKSGQLVHSNVAAVIARFNLTANWVCSEIVLTANIDERAALIAKLIRLAFKCYRQCNFQTLAQIVYGLQSPEVERLKKTWARVSTWEMRQFRSMREFVSHLRNFKLLREATAACIAEYGPPLPRGSISMPPDSLRASLGAGVKPAASSGCIPFLGLWLRDLAMNAELPTFLDPTSPKSAASLDSTGSLTSVADPSAFSNLPPLPHRTPLLPLVNVHKFRMMAGIIQRLVSCQEVAEGYTYRAEADVYFKCLKLRALEPTLLRECSLRLEP